MQISTLFPLHFAQEFPDDSARSDASLEVEREREKEAASPASDEKDKGAEGAEGGEDPPPAFPPSLSPYIPSLLLLLLSAACIAAILSQKLVRR